MEIYTITHEDDSKIVLEKKNFDLAKYEISRLENGNIELNLIKKKEIRLLGQINEEITGSRIKECVINDYTLPPSKLKFNTILHIVYNLIDDGPQIIKNTMLKMKTVEKNDSGYKYYSKLGLSIRAEKSFKILQEVFNQCQINAISFQLVLKTRDNTNITIRTESEIKKTLSEDFIKFINSDKYSVCDKDDSEGPEEDDSTSEFIERKDDAHRWAILNKQLDLLHDSEFILIDIGPINYRINKAGSAYKMDDSKKVGKLSFNKKTNKIEIK